MSVSSALHRCFYRGHPITLENLCSVFASEVSEDVVFLGENHEHAEAQRLELRLLEALWLNCRRRQRPLVLSLEFLDRSQQQELDKAIARDELEEVVPEPYLPLVRFARAHEIAVVAANAPRKITGQVAKLGRAAVMESLSASERLWCAPMPWPTPSEAYRDAFYSVMQQMLRPDPNAEEAHQERLQRMFQAQSLWDATMAYSIVEALERYPHAQVMHVTGLFHVEKRLGTVEMLARYRDGHRSLVGIVYPEALVNASNTLDGDVVIFAP
jgi:uncharacterized iron-regulated protein